MVNLPTLSWIYGKCRQIYPYMNPVGYVFDCFPAACNRGQLKLSSGFPTKNVIILLVTCFIMLLIQHHENLRGLHHSNATKTREREREPAL